jgi:hypothetical protein
LGFRESNFIGTKKVFGNDVFQPLLVAQSAHDFMPDIISFPSQELAQANHQIIVMYESPLGQMKVNVDAGFANNDAVV